MRTTSYIFVALLPSGAGFTAYTKLSALPSPHWPTMIPAGVTKGEATQRFVSKPGSCHATLPVFASRAVMPTLNDTVMTCGEPLFGVKIQGVELLCLSPGLSQCHFSAPVLASKAATKLFG